MSHIYTSGMEVEQKWNIGWKWVKSNNENYFLFCTKLLESLRIKAFFQKKKHNFNERGQKWDHF